jgi:hypothetical protein
LSFAVRDIRGGTTIERISEMQDTLEYVIGSRVRCAGDECGEVEFVVVDPVADRLTHLVVRATCGAASGSPSRSGTWAGWTRTASPWG